MFLEIHEALEPSIEAGQSGIIDLVDSLFTAHRMGHIILCLKRRQLRLLDESTSISGLSRRMLPFLSNRASDYRAALSVAARSILVCPDNVPLSVIPGQKRVSVPARLLTLQHVLTQKFFLGEAILDVQFSSALCSIYFSRVGYPSSYVAFRPLAGGGGAMAQVLSAEGIAPAKGIVLCDNDTHASTPPFRQGTTACSVFDEAQRLSLLHDGIGLSELSPFFGFVTTNRHAIENMVGPYLLQCYFDANNRRDERTLVQAAFPHFPALDAAEWIMWQTLDLKNGTPLLNGPFAEVRAALGAVPAYLLARIGDFSRVKIPGDVIRWSVDNELGTRWSSSIRRAVNRDLDEPSYRDGVESIATVLLNVAAGDRAAERS